jgi:hypothetical protein
MRTLTATKRPSSATRLDAAHDGTRERTIGETSAVISTDNTHGTAMMKPCAVSMARRGHWFMHRMQLSQTMLPFGFGLIAFHFLLRLIRDITSLASGREWETSSMAGLQGEAALDEMEARAGAEKTEAQP